MRATGLGGSSEELSYVKFTLNTVSEVSVLEKKFEDINANISRLSQS